MTASHTSFGLLMSVSGLMAITHLVFVHGEPMVCMRASLTTPGRLCSIWMMTPAAPIHMGNCTSWTVSPISVSRLWITASWQRRGRVWWSVSGQAWWLR